MIENIKTFIKERSQLVLATAKGGQPYCSLMNYITDESVKHIYMISHRHTKKFSYICMNPKVSLLIDTRDLKNAQAMTILGTYKDDGSYKAEDIREKFIRMHSHMKSFIEDPDAVVICIKIESVQLLTGLTDACYVAF